MKQPATMEESLAAMQAQLPNLAEFGRSGVFDRIGFRQTFIAADKSAIQVGLHLPPELGAKLVGVHDLGGTTIENYTGASSQGWNSKCPDLEEANPVLTLAHFGKPGADAYPMPGVPQEISSACIRRIHAPASRHRQREIHHRRPRESLGGRRGHRRSELDSAEGSG